MVRHYFETLTFQFQSYFRIQMKRALEILIECAFTVLYNYMTQVLTYGPHQEYAARRFLSTCNNRRRLNECMHFVLKSFIEEGDLAFDTDSGVVYYHIPRIYGAHMDRIEGSHVILAALLSTGGKPVNRLQLATFIEGIGSTLNMAILNDLVESKCVSRTRWRRQLVYTLNWN